MIQGLRPLVVPKASSGHTGCSSPELENLLHQEGDGTAALIAVINTGMMIADPSTSDQGHVVLGSPCVSPGRLHCHIDPAGPMEASGKEIEAQRGEVI